MKRKELAAIGLMIFACLAFYSGTWFSATYIQLSRSGTDIYSIFDPIFESFFLAFASFIFFILAVNFSKKNLRARIKKETYWSILLIFIFAGSAQVILNFVFVLSFPIDWIFTISVISATPLACYIAGYRGKHIKTKLAEMGIDQGLTIFILILMAAIPVIQLQFGTISFSGTIVASPDMFFQNVNGSEGINKIENSSFDISVPIKASTNINFDKLVQISNPAKFERQLSVSLDNLRGNFTGIRLLTLSFLLGDGQRIYTLNYAENNFDISGSKYIAIGGENVTTMEITYSTGSLPLRNEFCSITSTIDSGSNLSIMLEIYGNSN